MRCFPDVKFSPWLPMKNTRTDMPSPKGRPGIAGNDTFVPKDWPFAPLPRPESQARIGFHGTNDSGYGRNAGNRRFRHTSQPEIFRPGCPG
jgi:hypothetical protein